MNTNDYECECNTVRNIIDLLYLPTEGKLIPESDKKGNIEYKLRLDKKDMEKRDKMVSQLLWRMNEGYNLYGKYEAHYILGIHDDGTFSNMTEQDLQLSTNILKNITKKANSKIINEKIYVFPVNKMITHIIIRKDYKEKNVPESNIMIMGASSVGKSSLMGRLTYGQKDDGNGFTRKLVLRHRHEKISGTTSQPKYDTIGFTKEKNIINYSVGIDFTLENVYNTADRLLNLIDIPGDIQQSMKTILYTVSSIKPDNIIICIPHSMYNILDNVSDNISDNKNENNENFMDIEEFIKYHTSMYKFIMTVCIVHHIQPIFVLTKYDLLKENNTIMKNENIFTKISTIFNKWMSELNETNNSTIDFSDSACINISNISDYGYAELVEVLGNYCMTNDHDKNKQFKDKLFIVNDVFMIPDIGTIFHGILKYGVVNIDETVTILCHNVITKQKIKSIHRKTLDVERLLPNESGSIMFYGNIEKLDKTSMIIDESWQKEIRTHSRIKPIFVCTELKSQQYTLFVENNIVTVLLTQTKTDLETIFEINCINNGSFIFDTNIGILKDERQNYFFIQFVR
jgi:GTPase